MKEKIELQLKTFSTSKKSPSFKIILNDQVLDKQISYSGNEYKKVFETNITDKDNKFCIELFDKDPNDTVLDGDKIVADVAIMLENLKFGGVACHPVDLHENYFHVTDWPADVPKKIKNNLYFGYNGVYEYFFQAGKNNQDAPVSRFIIQQHKKFTKEDFVINNVNDIPVGKDEVFIELLQEQIQKEKKLFS